MVRLVSIITLTMICAVPCFAIDVLPMETARGPCPKPKTVTNFQPHQLVGTWYDVRRYKNTILKGSCGTATYTLFPNATLVLPYEMKEFGTNTLTLSPLDVPNGKFKTVLNGIPTPFDYWLLDMDSHYYHTFYTCIELVPSLCAFESFFCIESVNIFSRRPTLDSERLERALAKITFNGLDANILREVIQDPTTCGRRIVI